MHKEECDEQPQSDGGVVGGAVVVQRFAADIDGAATIAAIALASGHRVGVAMAAADFCIAVRCGLGAVDYMAAKSVAVVGAMCVGGVLQCGDCAVAAGKLVAPVWPVAKKPADSGNDGPFGRD